jgi:serine/threonine protein kinase
VSSVSLYAKQLASALHFMHSSGVTHGDIKPDNILVDLQATPRTAFFADFGVSRTFNQHHRRNSRNSRSSGVSAMSSSSSASMPLSPLGSMHRSASAVSAMSAMSAALPFTQACGLGVGAPAFLAPEVFAGRVPSYAADIWAFGVTLFVMVYGRLPFRGASYWTVKHNVLNDALVFPPAAPQTQPWAELIAQLLVKDPQRRITASQLSMSPLLSSEPLVASDSSMYMLSSTMCMGGMPFPLAPSPSVQQLSISPVPGTAMSPTLPTPPQPIAVSDAEEAAALTVATVKLSGPLGGSRVAADMAAFAMEHARSRAFSNSSTSAARQ